MSTRRHALIAVTACLAMAGCDLLVTPQQRVDRAEALIGKGDYDTASIELRNALSKDPGNARGRLLLARTEFWMGDAPAAQRDLERAIEAGASGAATARLNAQILRALGDYKALEVFAGRQGSGLDEADRLMFLGQAQLGLNQSKAARTSFDGAVKLAKPGLQLAEVRSAQAIGLASGGDVQAAFAILDQVISGQPDYKAAVLLKAGLLLQRGEYADAEAVVSTANPGEKGSGLSVVERVQALNVMTEAQLGQGKFAEAQRSIKQLADIAPSSPLVAYLSGRLNLAQGKGADAVTELQKTVRAMPDFLPARVMLGLAYLNQGSAALAEAEFQRVLAVAPDNVEVRKLLAQSQMRQGRAASAESVLEPALATDVRDASVLALAGRAKLMHGERDQGYALIDRSLAMAPDSPQLRLEMAATYLMAGDAQRALELVASVPDGVGGERKRQIQFLALAAGKDRAAARLEIAALVTRNPKDVQLLNLAARWLANQGDLDGARAYLSQALAATPNDPRTLVNVGIIERAAKRDVEARKAFESAIAFDKTNADAYLALAMMADAKGDRAAVLDWLQRWQKADPQSAAPRLLLARMAFQNKDPAEGRRRIDDALKARPNDAAAEAAAGQVLLEAGLFDEALGHFRTAESLDPRNPQYDLGAARAQLALDQRDAARESLRGALAKRVNWLPAVALLAQVELRSNRVDAALALADGLKGDPATAADGFMLEGDIRLGARQPAIAAKAYAESARSRPTARAAIGESRARQAAQLARPEQPLVAWLAANPTDTAVRLALAQVYQQQADSAAALREYELVVQAQPDNAIALNNLAWLYAERGDPRGEAMARRAYDKAPNAPAVADTLGWILYMVGNAEEAVRFIQQAHDMDKESAEIEYHLGAVLLKLGRTAEAKQLLQSAIAAGKAAPWVGQAQRLLADAG